MTSKNWISFFSILLFFTACGTSKSLYRTPFNLPDELLRKQLEQSSNVQNAINETRSLVSECIDINNVVRMSSDTWQGRLQMMLDSMVNIPTFETTQLGLCVFDLTDDRMLYSQNPDQRMRPASNQKLVTAITCLDQLGGQYCFQPIVLNPGWGWCWDDKETGMTDFKAKGVRWNSDTLYYEKKEGILRELLVPMMKKSDNLLAESLFWQLPAQCDLRKVTRKDCVDKVDEVMEKAGIVNRDYVIADGSGLSLYNYLSPRILLMLLRYAHQNAAICTDLYFSLPVAGVDGTLSKRMKGTPAEGNVHAKTGTVTGVSTLSGYCTHSSGHVLAFSIMNQGIPQSAVGRDYQDKICVILCE